MHGKEEADKALEAARAVFSAGRVSENMPTAALSESDFCDGAVSVIDLVVKTGLAPSKAEARRLIQQGGISVDDRKVESIDESVGLAAFEKGYVVVRKGKKSYIKGRCRIEKTKK